MSQVRKPGEKCGTCRFFVARNHEEAKLATYARDESECGPGEWVFQGVRKVGCHGGPVYGHCQKAGELSAPGQEPFPPSRVASTFWCRLWRVADGLQIRQAGSVNRGAPAAEANAGLLALGAVAVLAGLGEWQKRRGKGSANHLIVGELAKWSDYALEMGLDEDALLKVTRVIPATRGRSAGYDVVYVRADGSRLPNMSEHRVGDDELVAADSRTRDWPGTGYQGVKPR